MVTKHENIMYGTFALAVACSIQAVLTSIFHVKMLVAFIKPQDSKTLKLFTCMVYQ